MTDLFSTRGVHGAFTIVGEGLAGWSFRVMWETRQEVAAHEGAIDLGLRAAYGGAEAESRADLRG